MRLSASTPVLPTLLLHQAPTPDIYPLSLHDALPISDGIARLDRDTEALGPRLRVTLGPCHHPRRRPQWAEHARRSEEHTSELQSLTNIVCRLLLEKKT